MKKLIALTLSLAIVLCFSFVVMATEPIAMTYSGGTDGTFTATVDSAVVGDQATLIAFKGTELGTDPAASIEYIDQQTSASGTTTFTFKMKSAVVANAVYTVKVGGSLLTTPLTTTNYIPYVVSTPTGYTISGTVSNAADLNIIGDEGLDAIYNDAWKTTVVLKESVYAETYLQTVVVDGTSKTFSLTDVADGNYVIAIVRDGYLPRQLEITVAGENIDLGDKTLLGGDLYGSDLVVYTGMSTDLFIDALDLGSLVSVLGADYESASYLPKYDLEPDLFVDAIDLGAIVTNLGSDYSTYGEIINY